MLLSLCLILPTSPNKVFSQFPAMNIKGVKEVKSQTLCLAGFGLIFFYFFFCILFLPTSLSTTILPKGSPTMASFFLELLICRCIVLTIRPLIGPSITGSATFMSLSPPLLYAIKILFLYIM